MIPVAPLYNLFLDEILAVYKRGGFNVTKMHCNIEFLKVMVPFLVWKDPPIKMRYAAAQ